MPFSHFLLAMLVVIIWGINFIFVALGLEEFPPLLLCAVRFTLASIPAIFFIKPPAVPFRWVVLYGLVMFALQFSLLFTGMNLGMTPGMASLLMQSQVFFSMFFAAVLFKEQIGFFQVTGALVSFAGVGIVAMHFDKNISFLGFVFMLASASAWGLGNLIAKKISAVNMIALVVWGSFVASIPILLLSLLMEGFGSIVYSFHHVSWVGITSLLYIVYVSTWVGYGVWNWLLNSHPVSIIVPFSLLVPVVGIVSSILIGREPFTMWKLLAGLLVIGGLFINFVGSRMFVRKLKIEAG